MKSRPIPAKSLLTSRSAHFAAPGALTMNAVNDSTFSKIGEPATMSDHPTYDYTVREISFDDVPALLQLWAAEPSLRPSSADNDADLRTYLARNPGISIGAFVDSRLVAGVLAGHDGRRGYPKHIFVHPSHRRSGIGIVIMRKVIHNLAAQGIFVSHYSVANSNAVALKFFQECFSHPDFEVEEITTSRRFELRHVQGKR